MTKEIASKPRLLYINESGNGALKMRERLLFRYPLIRGYEYWHAHIDWPAQIDSQDSAFLHQCSRATMLAKGLLALNDHGVAIVTTGQGMQIANAVRSNLADDRESLWIINIGNQPTSHEWGMFASGILLPGLVEKQMAQRA